MHSFMQTHTRTNGESALAQLTDCGSCAHSILHRTCVFLECLESSPFIILRPLIYTPSEVPLFDGKPTDIFGRQHLKSLSAEQRTLSCAVCCVFNVSQEVDLNRKSEEERTPPAISCYSGLVDCYIGHSLSPHLSRLSSGSPETWDIHRPNARNSCFGHLRCSAAGPR